MTTTIVKEDGTIQYKILFDVLIADSFHIEYYPLPWPQADGQSESKQIEIQFTPTSGDSMKDTEKALDKHIKDNYPNKDYRIYYWWWM